MKPVELLDDRGISELWYSDAGGSLRAIYLNNIRMEDHASRVMYRNSTKEITRSFSSDIVGRGHWFLLHHSYSVYKKALREEGPFIVRD